MGEDDECEPGCTIDQHMHPGRDAGPRAVVTLDGPPEERRVLVQATAYSDGTGVLEVADDVSDDQAASYLLHVASIAERGEHRG